MLPSLSVLVGIKQNIARLCGTNYDMYKLVKKGLPFEELVVTCICISLFVFLLMAGAGTPTSMIKVCSQMFQALFNHVQSIC